MAYILCLLCLIEFFFIKFKQWYPWEKCETELDAQYEGRELGIFDHVEVTGISLFEMDRTLESQVRDFGEKK